MSSNCHVLIIEDEPLIALSIQTILEDEGVTSFAFADTQAAAIASALSHHPDVITSDVKLVHGTGPLAVDAIYKTLGEIPVIFLTATPNDCTPCNPPGQVLRKPIKSTELAAAFHSALE